MAGSELIRVILVDDHPVVLEGLAAGLSQFADIKIVGKAADLGNAKALILTIGFDLLITDLYLSDERDGLELLQHAGNSSDRKKAVLTYSTRVQDILDANNAGADAYLIKDSEIEEIAAAIRTIGKGGRPPLPADLEAALWQKVRSKEGDEGRTKLSEREKRVLELMMKGMTSQEIAATLFLSPRIIRRSNTEIFGKLEVRNRSEAVAKALKENVL